VASNPYPRGRFTRFENSVGYDPGYGIVANVTHLGVELNIAYKLRSAKLVMSP
jgi:hypothetical protein